MKAFYAIIVLLISACGNANVPLDAEARRMVDSLSAAHIGLERRDIDSICKQQQTTLLPHLIDSIKQMRLQQIQEQLKTIPK